MIGTCIVTGATSGIGAELAKQLAENRWKVIATGRNTDKLKQLSASSKLIITKKLDLSSKKSIVSFAEFINEKHPDASLLFNNAAVQFEHHLDDKDYKIEHVEEEIFVNLTAPILLTKLLLRTLQKNRGQVMNISSGLGLAPKGTAAVYCATKAGLNMFGEAVRAQRSESIRVSEAILPLVDTPMTEGRGSGKISAQDAAGQIIAGALSDMDRVHVGKTRLLPAMMRIAPGLVKRILKNG